MSQYLRKDKAVRDAGERLAQDRRVDASLRQSLSVHIRIRQIPRELC